MADSEHELLRDEEPEGPGTGEMFAALLNEMKKMNENILNMSEPADSREELSSELDESENTEQSLGEPVANLAASTSKQPSILDDIARDLDASEKTGPGVSEGLAGIVNSLLKEKLPEEKIQTKVDNYPRPQNVTGLRAPRVNPLIWAQLSPQSRTNDSKFQKSQHAIVASVVAMTKATDIILESSIKDNKELIQLMTDSIALAIQGQHDLNTTRRRAMKVDLNKDYAALCTTPVDQTSEYLFGDLSKLAKDITDANKLTKKVRPSPSTQSNYNRHGKRHSGGRKSYGNNRFAPYRGRNDFLSKGHYPRNRKKEGNSTKQ